jgi:hypothetical protein
MPLGNSPNKISPDLADTQLFCFIFENKVSGKAAAATFRLEFGVYGFCAGVFPRKDIIFTAVL